MFRLHCDGLKAFLGCLIPHPRTMTLRDMYVVHPDAPETYIYALVAHKSSPLRAPAWFGAGGLLMQKVKVLAAIVFGFRSRAIFFCATCIWPSLMCHSPLLDHVKVQSTYMPWLSMPLRAPRVAHQSSPLGASLRQSSPCIWPILVCHSPLFDHVY